MLDQEGPLAILAAQRGVERAAKAVQAELRAQVASAGFAGGGASLANAWRYKLYPTGGRNGAPVALVYTRTPEIIGRFEDGKTITSSHGKYLAWPTALNLASARRGEGGTSKPRVTPAEMVQARGEAVVLRTHKPGVALWCLKVQAARGRTKTGRLGKVRVTVRGGDVQILTGRIKAADRQQKFEALLAHGYAAMFFLDRSVTSRKRLDVGGTFDRAGDILDASVRAELAA